MNSHLFPPKRILVATDLTPTSAASLAFARHFHEKHGSTVQVLHAQHFELPPYFSSGQVEALKRELRRSSRAGVDYVRTAVEPALGFMPEIKVVEGRPAESILAAAAHGIDLVIVGTHARRGAGRMWLGSVAEQVLRESSVPVLAAHRDPTNLPFRQILCPVNLTEVGGRAMNYAAQISRAAGAEMTVLHVAEAAEPPLDCTLVGDEVKKQCTVQELRLHGNAAKAILELSTQIKPDLIVMGAERKAGALRGLFSSTTELVMQRADVPLLVVPNIAEAAATPALKEGV